MPLFNGSIGVNEQLGPKTRRKDFDTAWNVTSGFEQVPALAGVTALDFLIPTSGLRVKSSDGFTLSSGFVHPTRSSRPVRGDLVGQLRL